MFNPAKNQHADPSGTSLPEFAYIPTGGGNEIQVPSPNGHDHHLQLVPPATPLAGAHGAEPLALAGQAARAILAGREDLCRDLGLLPRGYFGDDLDHLEFFEPAAALAELACVPDHGLLLEDPVDGPGQRALLLAEAIEATIREMHRAFDHKSGPSARLRLKFQAACSDELRQLADDLAKESEPAATARDAQEVARAIR